MVRTSDLKRRIAQDLDDARRRTHELLNPVDDERLMAQHDDLLSPLAWDYGHVGIFEELWLVQRLSGGYLAHLPAPPGGRVAALDMVSVPAGSYPIGSGDHEPYDNEHPRHEVELDAFRIDRFPVTCGEYLRFMEDGGYARQELWGEDGWEWIL